MPFVSIKTQWFRFTILSVSLLLLWCVGSATVSAQVVLPSTGTKTSPEEKPVGEKPLPVGPVDEFNRGVPRTMVAGFFKAGRDGDFERAANYLDLRNLPPRMDKPDGPALAHQLKVVLDRALWVDPDLLSNNPKGNLEDGLPAYRDIAGRIGTKKDAVDVLLQQVPREDGVTIWKFSNRTVSEIPRLYEEFGYRPFEQKLSKLFPDYTILGWEAWQWVLLLALMLASFFVAWLVTWIGALLIRRNDTERGRQLAEFCTGPGRILLWFGLATIGVNIIGPSATLRLAFHAHTLLTFAVVWALVRLVELVFHWWAERLERSGQQMSTVLLRPVKTFSKLLIIVLGVLVWLSNAGYNISAILTGIGVGGIAIALAVQDSLKNLIASITILLDKPFQIGERVVVKDLDGEVEEIGLRSTKLRLVTGHQATVPNIEMANADIENISRRPRIRRWTNLSLRYDTPLAKVEKAVTIIQEILTDHEGMDPEFPPRVYFSELNTDSLNILMAYWYHPADFWDFNAFNQKINVQIMKAFEREGINFAYPTTTTYLTQEDGQSLHLNISQTNL